MPGSLEVLNMADIAFLKIPPAFVSTQIVAQSITSSTWTSITLTATGTQAYDNYSGHSNSTNTSRYTAPITGWYTVAGVVSFAQNGTGERGSRLAINGTSVSGTAGFVAALSSNVTSVVTATRDIFLNLNDYVEVQGWQTSGGALNTAVFTDNASALWVRFSHF